MGRYLVVTLLAGFASAAPACAAQAPTTAPAGVVINEVKPQAVITVAVNKSQVIRTTQSIRQASVGNPGIADINAFATNQMLLTGKKGGSTSLTIFTDDGAVQMLDVEVHAAGEATTRPAAATKKGVSRLEGGDIRGFVKLTVDNTVIHLNVDQIAAVITAPADGSVQETARIVLAAQASGALQPVLEVPAEVLPPHEVLKAIQFAKARRE